jgi:hypothetical protein
VEEREELEREYSRLGRELNEASNYRRRIECVVRREVIRSRLAELEGKRGRD